MKRPYGFIKRLAGEKNGLKNMQVLILEIKPLESTSRHFHPNEEVFYLLHGGALFFRGEEKSALREGDVIAVLPNMPHQVKNIHTKIPCEFLVILSPPYDPNLVRYC